MVNLKFNLKGGAKKQMKYKTKEIFIDMARVSGIEMHRREDGRWEMTIETKRQRKHCYGHNEIVEEWTGKSSFTCEAVESFNIFVKTYAYNDNKENSDEN